VQRGAGGELHFRLYVAQAGRGPHIHDFVYASDPDGETFHSNIEVAPEGVVLSDTEGKKKFGINVRWNVEGFGFLYITADNGGEFYELPPGGKRATLNLNHELAKSRVARNRRRVNLHLSQGWKPSREAQAFLDLSDAYFEDATKAQADGERCGALGQKSLYYALWAGEMIELEKARWDIQRQDPRPGFLFGCDGRGYFQMNIERFLEYFVQLFSYATITHYLLSGTFEDFEPSEGKKQFALRKVLLDALRARGVTVEGRPLFWAYKTTAPEWLKKKSFDELLKYVEKHAREVVDYYGNDMYAWEIVNEMHDWANECQLTPDQTIELTRLACDVTRHTNPRVLRLINNCCLFGEYIQKKKWTDLDAKYPQRTPFQFMKQLVEAGVDFNITGLQIYFSLRDLSDTVLLIEKFKNLGKPIHITEVGASSGPSERSIKLGGLGLSLDPCPWHRPWDEELQADWLEGVYTLMYSKPYVEAISWYDFVDPYSFVPNGGLLRSPQGEKKAAFERLARLEAQWKSPPKTSSTFNKTPAPMHNQGAV
jgi:GH35 family endo-1,4-beta-xylanase